MSKLLYGEFPLLFSPRLATIIGLNEAIVLQQISYWITNPAMRNDDHFFDSRYWVYNTYEKWLKQFPFLSERTLRRTVINLEKLNLISVGHFPRPKHTKSDDRGCREKWYTVNNEGVESLSLSDKANLAASEISPEPVNLAASEPVNLAASHLIYTETTFTETTHLSNDKCTSTRIPSSKENVKKIETYDLDHDKLKEIATKPRKKETGTPLPPDIQLSEEWKAVAIEKGVHSDWVNDVWEIFLAYWTVESPHIKKVDWKATWRTWCVNEVGRGKFTKPRNSSHQDVSSYDPEEYEIVIDPYDGFTVSKALLRKLEIKRSLSTKTYDDDDDDDLYKL